VQGKGQPALLLSCNAFFYGDFCPWPSSLEVTHQILFKAGLPPRMTLRGETSTSTRESQSRGGKGRRRRRRPRRRRQGKHLLARAQWKCLSLSSVAAIAHSLEGISLLSPCLHHTSALAFLPSFFQRKRSSFPASSASRSSSPPSSSSLEFKVRRPRRHAKLRWTWGL